MAECPLTGSSHSDQRDVEFFNSPSSGDVFFAGIFPLNTDGKTNAESDFGDRCGSESGREKRREDDVPFGDSGNSNYCTVELFNEKSCDKGAIRMQKGSLWNGRRDKLPSNQHQDLFGQTADNLLILGAGSFGQVIREIAEAMDCFGEIVFLDDDPELGSGPLADHKKLRSKFRYAYAAFGKNDLRSKWMNYLKAAGYDLPTD